MGIAQTCSIEPNYIEPQPIASQWQGLRAIHALGRLHGDLRGPNVILAEGGNKVGGLFC